MKLKKLLKEEPTKKDLMTRRKLLISLEDALTYLGYISYDEGWKKYEKEAMKLQAQIETLYRRLK